MERMRAKGRAIAPYNTTQFIMADHADDTTELLKLLEVERPNERKRDKASMDDEEEDYYYSSPSDEEDFMSKEFIKDYNRQQVNNLEMMSKQMLLREYMIVLRKNETLESRLSIVQEKENEKNEELKRVEMLKSMEEELDSLRQENQKLVRSNSEIQEILSKSTSNFSEDDENKDDDQGTPLNDTGYESNQN
jgi:protein HEXIM1/2